MPPVPGPVPRAGVVIPIRAFASGNARLAAVLDDRERLDLAMTMAAAVLGAAGELPIVVVSSAPEVKTWPAIAAHTVIDDPGTGLDGAVAAGCAHLAALGIVRIIVAHADLPRARPGSLVRFAADPPAVVSIVPCHRDDGTPVISLPVSPVFEFAYGPDSARRHAATARRAGLTVRVVRDADLGYDVDIPEDLLS